MSGLVKAVGGDATYGEMSFELLEWFISHCQLRPEVPRGPPGEMR